VGLPDLVKPGLRVIIAGTIAAWDRAEREHYYDTPGNKFWVLLHDSGLVPELLRPDEQERVLDFGVGLTDMVRTEPSPPGEPPRFDVLGFQRLVRKCRPHALAWVSKTAAGSYARAARERAPRGYGALSWTVAGAPAFVLPGPSGANNGMPLPLRVAMWSDLVDFLDSLEPAL
jgi:TDG/mug DNA glycosylase family protein